MNDYDKKHFKYFKKGDVVLFPDLPPAQKMKKAGVRDSGFWGMKSGHEPGAEAKVEDIILYTFNDKTQEYLCKLCPNDPKAWSSTYWYRQKVVYAYQNIQPSLFKEMI